jgi:hypothetical protein
MGAFTVIFGTTELFFAPETELEPANIRLER